MDEARDNAILNIIRSIPKGKTAGYAVVAEAAGYPRYHRLVVKLLQKYGRGLPWQRVTGSGGEIKLRLGDAMEQRFRLELEGVKFRGKRVAREHILSAEDLACLHLKSRAARSRRHLLPPR